VQSIRSFQSLDAANAAPLLQALVAQAGLRTVFLIETTTQNGT